MSILNRPKNQNTYFGIFRNLTIIIPIGKTPFQYRS